MGGTVVIGIGQERRGDDAIGLLVARRLAALPPANCRVLEHDGDGMDLLLAWEGADQAILVDALLSGGQAGELRVIDATEASLSAALFSSTSSHALGLAEAIELGRALGRLPDRVLIYGIEGADFATGSSPSPAVLGALDQVVALIREEIDDA
ncbi:MAG: hydrogenase maturation protease [Planctomycetes bacterium]|nr:hydrogenase maturation protease [Planctomycetota bacterium]